MTFTSLPNGCRFHQIPAKEGNPLALQGLPLSKDIVLARLTSDPFDEAQLGVTFCRSRNVRNGRSAQSAGRGPGRPTITGLSHGRTHVLSAFRAAPPSRWADPTTRFEGTASSGVANGRSAPNCRYRRQTQPAKRRLIENDHFCAGFSDASPARGDTSSRTGVRATCTSADVASDYC